MTISSVLEAIGFLILIAPLYFLFRAALSRSGGKMKSQLVGVIVVAPLFFAISGVLNGIATNEAADTYAKGEAKSTLSAEKGTEECRDEEREKGGKEFGEKYDRGASPLKDCEATEQEESAAENALSEASLRDAATGFGLAGRIGLAVALVYCCLWGMRVGLLCRFWGSLGMALGVAALLLLVQFCLIFFIYFALLLVEQIARRETARLGGGRGGPLADAGRPDREGNRTEGRRDRIRMETASATTRATAPRSPVCSKPPSPTKRRTPTATARPRSSGGSGPQRKRKRESARD